MSDCWRPASPRRGAAHSLTWLLATLIGAAAPAPATAQPAADLKRLSLEELLRVEVSTVARAPQPAAEVAAAVFVLTRDDIRRSGVTSLPEALRLVPGVHVARLDSARYAVGIRGFADRLSRALLVLIDGRAVYSPLFAGTYWETQDVFLEDVERIEVIRGPGGTLWGANAVNGIINVVTRSSAETHGLAVTGGVGTNSWQPLGARYGWALGATGHARAYVKGFQRDGLAPGASPYDAWHMAQGGARADWSLTGGRTLTVQGDGYAARLGQQYSTLSVSPPSSTLVSRDAPLHGGNVLARWTAPLGPGGHLRVQGYYDRTRRDERPVAETRDTVDLDVQHTRAWTRHTLSAGAGYRVTRGRIAATAPSRFQPDTRTDNLFSVFAQDEVAIVPDRLRVSLGAKAEHNALSGYELQPSARVLWTLTGAQRLTASVTRAVRTPSRVETDYGTESLASPAVPSFVRLLPNRGFVPEKVVAYEAGYRLQPGARAYLTLTAFANQLSDLLSTDLLTAFVESGATPRLILPVQFANGVHGNSHGAELTADLRPAAWLRTTASYSFLRVQLTKDPGGRDVTQERRGEGLSPRHQAQVTASFDLPGRVDADVMWRHVSALPFASIPAYGAVNARLAWHRGRVELALVGQDLQTRRHVEWPSGAGPAIPMARRGYLSVTWRQ